MHFVKEHLEFFKAVNELEMLKNLNAPEEIIVEQQKKIECLQSLNKKNNRRKE